MNGIVSNLFIATKAGEGVQSIDSASLIAGKGIKGDRYYSGQGTFSEKLKGNPAAELSLIEKEEIDSFNKEHNQNLTYGDFRRNIVTTGIRLCEPCLHLAETVNTLVLPHLVGRGGLRAQIVSSNEIQTGDAIKG